MSGLGNLGGVPPPLRRCKPSASRSGKGEEVCGTRRRPRWPTFRNGSGTTTCVVLTRRWSSPRRGAWLTAGDPARLADGNQPTACRDACHGETVCACGQPKAADQFAPGKHICVACQARRAPCGLERKTEHGVAWRRSMSPATASSTRRNCVPSPRPSPGPGRESGRSARRSANCRSSIARYDELYQQELRRARSEPLPIRRGRHRAVRIGFAFRRRRRA
jgi:hypothetical protein